MNIEKIESRISKLEMEIAKLRRMKNPRERVPDFIVEKLTDSYQQKMSLDQLSIIIRRFIFPMYPANSVYATMTIIKTSDMSDEQYDHYCQVLSEIVDILAKYQCKENVITE